MTLAEFLLARIAEDEAVARAAQAQLEEAHLTWQAVDRPNDPDRRSIEHALLWSPGRVFAECDVKRRIVERAKWCAEHSDYGTGMAAVDDEYDLIVLKVLALPYNAHPDYDQAWRP